MNRYDAVCLVAVAAFLVAVLVIASGPSGGLVAMLSAQATAAWVQAIGGIAAVVAALLVGESQFRQHRLARQEDTRNRTQAAMRSAWWICTMIEATVSLAMSEEKKNGFAPGVAAALTNQASSALDMLKTVALADLPDGDTVNVVLNYQQVAASLLSMLALVERHGSPIQTFRHLHDTMLDATGRLNEAVGRYEAQGQGTVH